MRDTLNSELYAMQTVLDVQCRRDSITLSSLAIERIVRWLCDRYWRTSAAGERC